MLRGVWQVLTTAAVDWQRDDAPRFGAAIAYYAVFAVAPVLVIAIAIAGTFFGRSAAQGEMAAQLDRFVGSKAAAQAIEDLVADAARPRTGHWATTLSVVALLFGASGVFSQLKRALDRIWEVEPQPGAAILGVILQYAWSVAMVVCVGLFLLASLVVSLSISAVSDRSGLLLPDPALQALDWCLSISILTLLFATIFKLLPDVRVAWRDVWVGGVVTALLFTLGKFLIGMYLARSAVASAYGAAGSLVLVLVWTYYSAQIVLFGAEVTQAYARIAGSPIVPARGARFTRQAEKFGQLPTRGGPPKRVGRRGAK